MDVNTHFHIFTWVVGIILFLVAAVLADGSKGKKITHMIARLFYVLIVVSGFLLFLNWSSQDAALYGVKFLLGLVTIGMMEMVLVRSSKGKKVTTFWILFFVFLFATMFLGFKLPAGITWFA
jgi:hypothetical protein